MCLRSRWQMKSIFWNIPFLYTLGWPESLFGFLQMIIRKNPNKFLANSVNVKMHCCDHSITNIVSSSGPLFLFISYFNVLYISSKCVYLSSFQPPWRICSTFVHPSITTTYHRVEPDIHKIFRKPEWIY